MTTENQAPEGGPALTNDQLWASWLSCPAPAEGEDDTMEARVVKFGRAVEQHARAALAAPAPQAAPARCEYCDGTGDVHRADGEWLGECNQCPAAALHAFKNFHRLLCERFGYGHDEKDWRRDQLSLIEFIAAKIPAPAEGAARDAFELYFAESRKSKGAGKRPTFERFEDGTYKDDHTQRHWWTWQNARTASQDQPKGAEATGDVWLKHDDDLRFVARVLSGGLQAPEADIKAARAIVHGLRTTARSHAQAPAPAQSKPVMWGFRWDKDGSVVDLNHDTEAEARAAWPDMEDQGRVVPVFLHPAPAVGALTNEQIAEHLPMPAYHDGFGRSPDLWTLEQIGEGVRAALAHPPVQGRDS